MRQFVYFNKKTAIDTFASHLTLFNCSHVQLQTEHQIHYKKPIMLQWLLFKKQFRPNKSQQNAI